MSATPQAEISKGSKMKRSPLSFCPIRLSAFPKRRVNGLEKFFGFFEKNSRFIVKFRKFFGFIFFTTEEAFPLILPSFSTLLDFA
jgi:hypothetical protein